MIETRSILGVLILSALVIALALQLPTETAKRLSREGGLIESASLVLLALGLLACLRALALRPSRPWLSGSLVMLMFLLRELDFHRLFTPRSIDSTGFYRSATIPLHIKVFILILGLPFLVAFFHVLWLGLRHLREAIRQRQGWIGHVVLAVAMVAVARLAEKFGLDHTHVIEEVAEVAFAAFALLVVLAFTRSARAADRPRSGGR